MMAKMLVASLQRSGYTGDAVIFHNQRHALFRNGRQGLQEIPISAEDLPKAQWRRTPHRLKFRVAALFPFSDYAKILFLDADSLVFQDPTALLLGPEQITYQTEPEVPIQYSQFNEYLTVEEMRNLTRDGINSGTFAVSGNCFHAVMQEWDAIDRNEPVRGDKLHEQAAWNRLILDGKWQAAELPIGAVIFPFFPVALTMRANTTHQGRSPAHGEYPILLKHKEFAALKQATILHLLGPSPPESRLAIMFGYYMMRYHADPNMTLFNILDP